MKKQYLFIVSLFLCCLTFAQPGTLDTSFASKGFAIAASPTLSNINLESSRECFVDPDGKLYVVLESTDKTLISRRLANGKTDITWGKNGYSAYVTLDNPHAVRQPDGKIVVGGESRGNFVLARFTASGDLDIGFGIGGVILNDLGSNADAITAVGVAADGAVYVAGVTTVNGSSLPLLFRYTPEGVLDTSFGINGMLVIDFGSPNVSGLNMIIQENNELVLLGTVTGPDGPDFALARLNENGKPDSSFNGTGTVITNFGGYNLATALAVGPDGSIYTGGFGFGFGQGGQQYGIAKFTSDGQLDLSFNSGLGSASLAFSDSYESLTNIYLQTDGKILAAGQTNINIATNSYDIGLERFNIDGSIDANFGTNGLVTADFRNTLDLNQLLTVKPDGSILVGGYNDGFPSGGNYDFSLFQFTSSGLPDLLFGTQGKLIDYVASSTLNYLALYTQTDGKLLLIGESNDSSQKVFLSRLNANGTIDNAYGIKSLENEVPESGFSCFQPDGKLLRISNFYSPVNSDFLISRYNLDGTPDLNFGNQGRVISDFGGNEYVYTTMVQTDNKIVVTGYRSTDHGSEALIARYNSDGSLDNSFGTSGLVTLSIETDNYLSNIIQQPDGKILLAGMAYVYPPDFSYIHYDIEMARLNVNGSLDNSFGQGGTLIKDFSDLDISGNIILRKDGSIIYTYGIFNTGPNNFDLFAGELLADGSTNNSFGQSGRILVDGLAILLEDDQHFLIGGQIYSPQNNAVFSLARYNADGSIDNGFGDHGKVLKSFTAGDNYFAPVAIRGNSLFTLGGSSYDIRQGIIAKFNLDVPKVITCPQNLVVATDRNSCSAKVSHIDPTFLAAGNKVKYTLTGATKGTGTGSASGKVFNKGITTVTYTLNNDPTKTCTFTTAVEDREPPVIEGITASNTLLWPADRSFKDVYINYAATDNCGIARVQVSVTSNEPILSNESGDQSPDWQIIDNHHIRLRAERLQSGNGRIYTIKITAIDLSGNQAQNTIAVKVPKTINLPCLLTLAAAPNPSHSYFLVSVASSCNDKINIRITDNKGNTVSTITNVQSPIILKLGEKLIPGIYYLEASQGSVIKTIKLIKQ